MITTVLRQGTSVLFFPEGTFVQAAGVLPFRLGAFKAAVDTQCAVIPVGLHGTRDILPAFRWLPRPGAIAVTIGAPITPEKRDWREMVRIRDRARAEIARAAGELPVEDRDG
jgi:1-acyl-sn-glycerol-3-phosphate acyltransferase